MYRFLDWRSDPYQQTDILVSRTFHHQCFLFEMLLHHCISYDFQSGCPFLGRERGYRQFPAIEHNKVTQADPCGKQPGSGVYTANRC